MDELQNLNQPSGTGGLPLLASAKNTNLIIKIVVGVIIAIVVGAGVTLGARIWDPVWNPFRPEPEDVIEKMFTKMGEVNALRSELKVEFGVIDEKLNQEMQILINLNTDADGIDPENPKVSMGLNIKMVTPTGNFLLGGETKTIGEISYFKLSELTLPAEIEFMAATFGVDINQIKGQWIKIDNESLKSLGGEKISEEDQKKLGEDQEKLREKLINLFKEKKPYYIKKELPDQKIGGKRAYHYILDLDRENLKETIPELFTIGMESSGRSLGRDESVTALMASGMTEVMDEFLERVGGMDIEIWIGKKDLLLYKVKIDKEIDTSRLEKGAKGKSTIGIDLEFSNFNKPVTIEVPENSIGIDQLIAPMLPLISPGLPVFPQSPGTYPSGPEEPSGYPGTSSSYLYEESFIQEDNLLYRASIMRVLLGILTR